MPELLGMIACTVNSYKRLIPGYWAPTGAAWGADPRRILLRRRFPSNSFGRALQVKSVQIGARSKSRRAPPRRYCGITLVVVVVSS
jgi:glutamine synthetase